MGPHTDGLNLLDIIYDLVDNSMLDIDPPPTSAGYIINQSLVWGRGVKLLIGEQVIPTAFSSLSGFQRGELFGMQDCCRNCRW
jgi:hypothetical protein